MIIKYCTLIQDYKSCCKNISILSEFIENNKCEWIFFFKWICKQCLLTDIIYTIEVKQCITNYIDQMCNSTSHSYLTNDQ